MKKLIWLIPVRLLLTVVCLYFIPGAGKALELNRELVMSGEIWRLVTGHFVHCSLNHLFWDAVAFTVLLTVGLRRDFKGVAVTALIGAPVISLSVLLLCPEIEVYRGLSGLDTALYAYLVLYGLYEGIKHMNRKSTIIYLLLLAGLLGKNIWEVCTGNVLFCNATGYVPVPIAHVSGLTAGFMVFALRKILPCVRSLYIEGKVLSFGRLPGRKKKYHINKGASGMTLLKGERDAHYHFDAA